MNNNKKSIIYTQIYKIHTKNEQWNRIYQQSKNLCNHHPVTEYHNASTLEACLTPPPIKTSLSPSVWTFFIHVPCELLKNVYSAVVEFYICALGHTCRLNCSNLYPTVLFSWCTLCFGDILKSLMTLDIHISPSSSDNFCFINFDAVWLGAYKCRFYYVSGKLNFSN